LPTALRHEQQKVTLDRKYSKRPALLVADVQHKRWVSTILSFCLSNMRDQDYGDSPTKHNSAETQPVVIDGPREITFDENVTVPPYSVSLCHLPLPARKN
jgi:hypothetical protein